MKKKGEKEGRVGKKGLGKRKKWRSEERNERNRKRGMGKIE